MIDTVSIFIPCLTVQFFPETGSQLAKLVKKFGYTPVFHKGQTCCGQIAYNDGFLKEARQVAVHFMELFGDDDIIVCPSGSCVKMVKNYPSLFQDDPEQKRKAERISNKIFEFSQFLVDVAGIEDVGAVYNGKVSYHESCSLKNGLGISEQPRKLINAVKGTELVQLNNADTCCGFGGKFSVRYPEISSAIVDDKVKNFIESEADILLMGEPGCLMNISDFLTKHHPGKKAMHIVDFLADNLV